MILSIGQFKFEIEKKYPWWTARVSGPGVKKQLVKYPNGSFVRMPTRKSLLSYLEYAYSRRFSDCDYQRVRR